MEHGRRPLLAGGPPGVHEVVHAGRGLRGERHDRIGQVGRVCGRPDLVRYHRQRLARRQAVSGREDLGREVVSRRAVEPGRPDDPEPATIPERLGCCLLARQLARAIRVDGLGWVVLAIASLGDPPAVKNPVGGDEDKVSVDRPARPCDFTDREGVATHRQLRVPGATVDVAPSRRVDHEVRSIPGHEPLGSPRVVKIVVRPAPGDRLRHGILERCNEGPAQAPTGPSHSHAAERAHASPELARRSPYWRS